MPTVHLGMRPSGLFLAAVLCVFVPQLCDADIKTERIEYKIGDAVFEGVLAYDDEIPADQHKPGVLVCHEWWGCNQYAQKRAEDLAEMGYVAFALDMYGKGQTTKDPKQAGEWSGKVMGDPQLLADRAAAGLKVLAEHARVDESRLAAIGYCMGGTVALELARSGRPHTDKLKVVTAFHASNFAAKDPAANANIKGSVLICHGADDTFVKPGHVEEFEKQMKEAKVDYQFISFGGAVHSFTNPDADKAGIPGVKYNIAADKRSWAAMTHLLRTNFFVW
jgi:dienelactone hydrolase